MQATSLPAERQAERDVPARIADGPQVPLRIEIRHTHALTAPLMLQVFHLFAMSFSPAEVASVLGFEMPSEPEGAGQPRAASSGDSDPLGGFSPAEAEKYVMRQLQGSKSAPAEFGERMLGFYNPKSCFWILLFVRRDELKAALEPGAREQGDEREVITAGNIRDYIVGGEGGSEAEAGGVAQHSFGPDEILVGMGNLARYIKATYVFNLAVHPILRGNRLGRLLMRLSRIIGAALFGADRITGSIERARDKLVKYYLRQGAVHVRTGIGSRSGKNPGDVEEEGELGGESTLFVRLEGVMPEGFVDKVPPVNLPAELVWKVVLARKEQMAGSKKKPS